MSATADLNGAAHVAIASVQDNLDRARDLVKEAVAQLMASFGGLRGVLERQHGLLRDITSSLGRIGEANFTTAAGRMVSEFVDEIVRVSHESMRIIEQLLITSEHVSAIVARAERIDGLARETRFIALNARIETQRAGEAGKTFKVVAEEVKRLAGASAELSAEIRREVDACFQSLRTTQKTAESLASHDMSTVIESRTSLVQTIERMDQVNRAVENALTEVSSSVAEAVRALQFEDLVSQLLNDASRRVKRITQLLLDAVAVVEQQHGDRAQRLSGIARDLREIAKPGSITQETMNQGSIELF